MVKDNLLRIRLKHASDLCLAINRNSNGISYITALLKAYVIEIQRWVGPACLPFISHTIGVDNNIIIFQSLLHNFSAC